MSLLQPTSSSCLPITSAPLVSLLSTFLVGSSSEPGCFYPLYPTYASCLLTRAFFVSTISFWGHSTTFTSLIWGVTFQPFSFMSSSALFSTDCFSSLVPSFCSTSLSVPILLLGQFRSCLPSSFSSISVSVILTQLGTFTRLVLMLSQPYHSRSFSICIQSSSKKTLLFFLRLAQV